MPHAVVVSGVCVVRLDLLSPPFQEKHIGAESSAALSLVHHSGVPLDMHSRFDQLDLQESPTEVAAKGVETIGWRTFSMNSRRAGEAQEQGALAHGQGHAAFALAARCVLEPNDLPGGSAVFVGQVQVEQRAMERRLWDASASRLSSRCIPSTVEAASLHGSRLASRPSRLWVDSVRSGMGLCRSCAPCIGRTSRPGCWTEREIARARRWRVLVCRISCSPRTAPNWSGRIGRPGRRRDGCGSERARSWNRRRGYRRPPRIIQIGLHRRAC